jgi:hypothetical protein
MGKSKGLFSTGYNAVEAEKKRQEENRAKMGNSIWRFFIKDDGDEAEVRFLNELPVTFYEHTVKNVVNGKERYDSVICTNEGCDLCDSGDKPTFKGAYLVYDKRPVDYKDKDGKEKHLDGQIRLYVQGTRVLSQLKRYSEKYGLTNRPYTIVRIGKGTSTTYSFEYGDKEPLSEEEIREMLPENLRKEYDGTEKSIYNIIENQLAAGIDEDSESSESDEVDDEESEKNLVGVEDKPKKKPMKPVGKKKGSSAKAVFKKKKGSK